MFLSTCIHEQQASAEVRGTRRSRRRPGSSHLRRFTLRGAQMNRNKQTWMQICTDVGISVFTDAGMCVHTAGGVPVYTDVGRLAGVGPLRPPDRLLDVAMDRADSVHEACLRFVSASQTSL